MNSSTIDNINTNNPNTNTTSISEFDIHILLESTKIKSQRYNIIVTIFMLIIALVIFCQMNIISIVLRVPEIKPKYNLDNKEISNTKSLTNTNKTYICTNNIPFSYNLLTQSESFISDFDLFCNDFLQSLFGISHFLGSLMSLLFNLIFVEIYLYKKILIFDLIIFSISCLTIFFRINYAVSLVAFLLMNFSGGSILCLISYFIVETNSVKNRSVFMLMVIMMNPMNGILSMIIDYVEYGYRYQFLVYAICTIIVMPIMVCVVKESTKIRFQHKQIKEIIKDLRYIAWFNGSSGELEKEIERISNASNSSLNIISIDNDTKSVSSAELLEKDNANYLNTTNTINTFNISNTSNTNTNNTNTSNTPNTSNISNPSYPTQTPKIIISPNKSKYTFFTLFKYPSLIQIIITSFFFASYIHLTLYLFQFYIQDYSFEFYESIIFYICFGLGLILGIPLIESEKFGRKKTLIFSTFFGTLLFIANIFLYKNKPIIFVMIFIRGVSNMVIFTYKSELYPTCFRNIGFNTSRIVSRLVCVPFPYVIMLSHVGNMIIVIINGIGLIMCLVGFRYVKETRGKELDEFPVEEYESSENGNVKNAENTENRNIEMSNK